MRVKLIAFMCFVALPRIAAAQSEPFPTGASLTGEADGGMSKANQAVDELFNYINPLVTTATKDARRADAAPSVITVITRRDLREWGYDTLSEAISHTVGFYMVDDHVLPNIAVRGVSGGYLAQSSVIKVLMNGAPVSFKSTNGNWLGAQLIPITAIESIEIIRGPASALYGADAFLGVINIITREAKSDLADLWIGGNWRQGNATIGYDQDMSVSLKRGRTDTFVAVRLYADDRTGMQLPRTPPSPTFPSWSTNRTTTNNNLQPSRSGLARVQYHFSDDTKLAVSGYFSYLERIDEVGGLVQLASGLDPQGRVSQNLTAMLQGFANAHFVSRLSKSLELNALATYSFGRPRTSNRVEVDSDFYYVRRDYGFNAIDAQAELRWTLMPALTFTGGLEIIYDLERLPSNLGIAKLGTVNTAAGGVIPGFTSRQGNLSIYNPAAYLQALWTVHERYLTVAAGVRYDYHTIYFGQPSARLGLVSELFDKVFVKALYGSAFKAPSPLLLYAIPAAAGDVTGNTGLLPQRVNTFELEATRTFLNFISVSTGLAYSILTNQAEFTQTGAYQLAANLSSVNSLSWETRGRLVKPNDIEGYATLEVNLTQRFGSDIGYKQDRIGTTNSTYPGIQAHAGVIKWLPKWYVRGMLDFTYASARNSTAANTLYNGGIYQLPQYFEVGVGLATMGFKLLEEKPITFGAVVRNILSQNAGEAGYLGVDYPKLPRSVFFYVNQEI